MCHQSCVSRVFLVDRTQTRAGNFIVVFLMEPPLPFSQVKHLQGLINTRETKLPLLKIFFSFFFGRGCGGKGGGGVKFSYFRHLPGQVRCWHFRLQSFFFFTVDIWGFNLGISGCSHLFTVENLRHALDIFGCSHSFHCRYFRLRPRHFWLQSFFLLSTF